MSAHIPFHLQVEIIKRVLPVKSLIRFRFVSKQWKSLIDSSEFISDHTVNQTRPHYLLVRCLLYEYKYVSIVDDDSFPNHKFFPYLPPIVKQATNARMVDISHGLVCLSTFATYASVRMIILWNPSLRKSVGIQFPSPEDYKALGFGVCPKTCDPKIVMITRSASMDWKAEVFTLSSKAWRRASLNYRPTNWLDNPVVIDGVIHWVARDSISYHIISFNLTSEEFGRVDLPDCLADSRRLHISKLNESFAVLNYCESDSRKPVCDVWVLSKSGHVPNSSFTKVLTVEVMSPDPLTSYSIIGFRKNGQPILRPKYGCDGFSERELKVYDPSSECVKDIGIHGVYFKMGSYKESLLLLNHFDSIIEL